MAVLIFFLGLFLLSGSDSFAQVYKYVNKEGKVCYTDNLTSSVFKDATPQKDKTSKEAINPKKRSASAPKDIMELGHAMLEEELAKPPQKQNRRLIQELTDILYGEGAGKKSKNVPN
jgi:hypothetical protein